MIIEKLRVKNYKSLEDVEIPLRPLTVFVGPNNSGKSNIFDCLEFLKELAFLGPQAVTRRGGFRDVVWGGDLKRAIDIQLEGRMGDGEGRPRCFKYLLEITGTEIAYHISKETFVLYQDGLETKLLERGEGPQIRTWSELEPSQETGVWSLREARLGIYRFQGSQDPQHHSLASFASSLADWGFYRLTPSRMLSPGPARKEAYLLAEGDNLGSVLLSIQSEDRETFNELEAHLKVAMPEIEDFSVALTEDGRAYPRWREKGLPSDFRIKQWMSSDGTRQILGLLALRFASKLPPVVCIEEPENFIHPGLLELVADMLRSIARKTQLLVSTHSPYLVDDLSPEDLLIVEKTDGRTRLTGVLESEGVRDAIRVLGLGELWYSGAMGGVP